MRFFIILCFVFLSVSAVFSQVPTIGGCQVFPADNPWNIDISAYPVHPNSDGFVAAISEQRGFLHADFGTPAEYGIPYIVVDNSQPFIPITYDAYGNESDPGPFPIPSDAPVEGGGSSLGDRHVLVVDKSNCMLYELYNAHKDNSGFGWTASSGAKFDLSKTAYRPDGWTSADAAGLPIFPGLVRYEEAATGAINHAIRFTAFKSQRGWIHPARHQAGGSDTHYPPMGLRLRMKADYDISADTGKARVILQALKKYGMILADNGSSWFISGTSNPNWNNDDLNQLKKIPGSAFEAVNTGPIKTSPESVSKNNSNSLTLEQNNPNPVFGKTEISFSISKAEFISLKVFNVGGNSVVTIFEGKTDEGSHTYSFDAHTLPAGIYFYRLSSSEGSIAKKMIVVK
jgi:hypothetical protein